MTVTEPVGELELVSQNATIVGYNGNKLGTAQGPEKLFDGDKENPTTGKWCEDGSNLWVAFDIGEERTSGSWSSPTSAWRKRRRPATAA